MRGDEPYLFDEYEIFVDKFKPKKTTDDCYTPPEVYEAIKEWVNDNLINLEGKKVARPFKPGGNYQAEARTYDENTVVIDNPPFSILSEIKDFYKKHGVKYFLFAPHLTLFGGFRDTETYIITNTTITYENGAVVNTDYVTNMGGDALIIVDSSLREKVNEIQAKLLKKKTTEKFKYPANVITSTTFDPAILGGCRFTIPRGSAFFIRRLDSQRPKKKCIFGGGFLISDQIAEAGKQVRKDAEQRRKLKEEANVTEWTLSDSEIQIIKTLK